MQKSVKIQKLENNKQIKKIISYCDENDVSNYLANEKKEFSKKENTKRYNEIKDAEKLGPEMPLEAVHGHAQLHY